MNNTSSIVSVFWNQRLVGQLALTPEGRCAFEYNPAFVSKGTSISPFFLPLRQELFLAKVTPFPADSACSTTVFPMVGGDNYFLTATCIQ